MNTTPKEIIYNIFSYLDIISKCSFGSTDKFNYELYKKYIKKKTSITQSLNYCNGERIKSFLYHYNDNIKYVKEYPFLLNDNFVHIELRDNPVYYFKILIYQPIYQPEKCILDYIREMKKYKIWKIRLYHSRG
jgi:hypothetical protein